VAIREELRTLRSERARMLRCVYVSYLVRINSDMLIVILEANSSVSCRSSVEFIESVPYLRDKAQHCLVNVCIIVVQCITWIFDGL
jgi:hypothetical protein